MNYLKNPGENNIERGDELNEKIDN